MPRRGSSRGWIGLGMIAMSVAAGGCAEGHSAVPQFDAGDAAITTDAGDQSKCKPSGSKCGSRPDDDAGDEDAGGDD